MNAKELAEATGLHENTIRNMLKRGELKAKKCGKYFIIDERQAKDLIFSKKIETENQNKIVETYELIELLEIRKKELFKGLKKILFSNLGLIPVDRKRKNESALNDAYKYSNPNDSIIILGKGNENYQIINNHNILHLIFFQGICF